MRSEEIAVALTALQRGHSMKLTNDDLLILLIEECGEVIQAATKCLRFGYDVDHDIGYGRNSDKLSEECGDLQAVLDAMPLNTALKEQAQYGKIAKAERAKAKFGRQLNAEGR
jgi:NTP pyrophosphatase (non-canonical NTP hydrolase)